MGLRLLQRLFDSLPVGALPPTRLDDQDALPPRLNAQAGQLPQAERRMPLRRQHQQIVALDFHEGRQPHVIRALAAVAHLMLGVSAVMQHAHPAENFQRIAM